MKIESKTELVLRSAYLYFEGKNGQTTEVDASEEVSNLIFFIVII